MTPSRPVRDEIVGAFGCGIICRGFSRARCYSRCRSFDVTSTYRIVISGSAWPSNFINAGEVTLERIISLAYVWRLLSSARILREDAISAEKLGLDCRSLRSRPRFSGFQRSRRV
jgi:hypothetical protein